MKYWGWLVLKTALAALVFSGLWTIANWILPDMSGGLLSRWPLFGIDLPYTTVVFVAGILGFLIIWLCAVDQVYRCRTCARRLRMPLEQGSFGSIMLGGAPYTEYICTYGHGKLRVPTAEVSSARAKHWIGYRSLWENLVQADTDARR